MKSFFRHLTQQVQLIIYGFLSFEKYLYYKEKLEEEEKARNNKDNSLHSK